MESDRTLQIALLEFLGKNEGKYLNNADLEQMLELAGENERKLSANLTYLARAGFIDVGSNQDAPLASLSAIKLLNKGIDFLIGDGGITVYKNEVTVRFHAETVQILASIIEKSAQPPQQKSALLKRLRELPVSAIEHLIKCIMEQGAARILELLLAM